MAKSNSRHPPNPIEIQLLIAKWKITTGQPQYKLAEQIGINPDFLSQIAHGVRPGHEVVPLIMQLTEIKT